MVERAPFNVTNEGRDIEIRPMVGHDADAVAALHASTFGPGRYARTAYRIREGGPTISPHCHGAWSGDDALVGAVTMSAITIGENDGHWLLGPIAVRADQTRQGLGQQLIKAALNTIAGSEPADATVILVGDLAYYGRFGFDVAPEITMPGPVDRRRLLIWLGPEANRERPNGPIRRSIF